ncbi:MAG: hypothetical protein ACRDZY_08760 [Acidimicrobiales bacterium]
MATGGGQGTALAHERLVEVAAPWADLLPERGLRRGSTLTVVSGPAAGRTALALSLLSAASGSGGWTAAVGLDDLGLVAAAQLGVDLARLALVPKPGPQWPVVTAALLESVEILLLRPPGRVRPADARRLSARARERGAVLVVLDGSAPVAAWPPGADLRLAVTGSVWTGLGAGHGHLRTRVVEVSVSGRRAAGRTRSARMWLPGPSGLVEPAPAVAPAVPAEPEQVPIAVGTE